MSRQKEFGLPDAVSWRDGDGTRQPWLRRIVLASLAVALVALFVWYLLPTHRVQTQLVTVCIDRLDKLSLPYLPYGQQNATELQQRFGNPQTSSETDTLVVYLSTHATIDNGQVCILTDEFGAGGSQGVIPLAEFLPQVARSNAAATVVLLDCDWESESSPAFIETALKNSFGTGSRLSWLIASAPGSRLTEIDVDRQRTLFSLAVEDTFAQLQQAGANAGLATIVDRLRINLAQRGGSDPIEVKNETQRRVETVLVSFHSAANEIASTETMPPANEDKVETPSTEAVTQPAEPKPLPSSWQRLVEALEIVDALDHHRLPLDASHFSEDWHPALYAPGQWAQLKSMLVAEEQRLRGGTAALTERVDAELSLLVNHLQNLARRRESSDTRHWTAGNSIATQVTLAREQFAIRLPGTDDPEAEQTQHRIWTVVQQYNLLRIRAEQHVRWFAAESIQNPLSVKSPETLVALLDKLRPENSHVQELAAVVSQLRTQTNPELFKKLNEKIAEIGQQNNGAQELESDLSSAIDRSLLSVLQQPMGPTTISSVVQRLNHAPLSAAARIAALKWLNEPAVTPSSDPSKTVAPTITRYSPNLSLDESVWAGNQSTRSRLRSQLMSILPLDVNNFDLTSIRFDSPAMQVVTDSTTTPDAKADRNVELIIGNLDAKQLVASSKVSDHETVFRLKPHANRTNSFSVALENLADEPVDVQVSVYSAASGFTGDWPAGRLLSGDGKVSTKVAEELQTLLLSSDVVPLPGRTTASTNEPVSVNLKPAAAKTTDASETQEPLAAAPELDATYGLRIEIRSTDGVDVWKNWIEIEPSSLASQISAQASYRADREMANVALQLDHDLGLPEPSKPIAIAWSVDGQFDETGQQKTKVSLPADQSSNAELYAQAPADGRTRFITLDVDGVPSAILLALRCTDNSSGDDVSLTAPQISLSLATGKQSPPNQTPSPADTAPAKVQRTSRSKWVFRSEESDSPQNVNLAVSAPAGMFSQVVDESQIANADVIELKSAGEVLQRRFAQHHVKTTVQPTTFGFSIVPTVTDWTMPVNLQGTQNTNVRLSVHLKRNGVELARDEITLQFDDLPPTISSFRRDPISDADVILGATLRFVVRTSDTAGIDSVQLAITKRDPLTGFLKSQPIDVPAVKNGSRWLSEVPTSELSVGDFRIVATTTDKLGQQATSDTLEFTVNPVPEPPKEDVESEPEKMDEPKAEEPPPTPPEPPTHGVIKGIVTVGKLRPEGVIVSIAGQKKIRPVKTDASGRFQFDKVPIGKQTVTAQFTFQGLIRRGTAVDIEPKPAEKAEWFRLPLKP